MEGSSGCGIIGADDVGCCPCGISENLSRKKLIRKKLIGFRMERRRQSVLFAQEVTEPSNRVLGVFNELMFSLIPNVL
jgi:hypothetical protein